MWVCIRYMYVAIALGLVMRLGNHGVEKLFTANTRDTPPMQQPIAIDMRNLCSFPTHSDKTFYYNTKHSKCITKIVINNNKAEQKRFRLE